MSWLEIFAPGMRHWREYQELQDDKILEAPAPGPGPMTVDLDNLIVTIHQPVEADPIQTGQDGDQAGQEGH